MALNVAREAALLTWVNGVNPEAPVTKLIQMMEDRRLLKFAYKVQRKVLCDASLASASPDDLELIFMLLQEDFRLMPQQTSLMMQKMSLGVELEIHLAKVVLVLCYCGFKKQNVPPLDAKTEIMIVSMFHFIQDDADGLSLDEGLDKFLTKTSVLPLSTTSIKISSPLSSSESPYISRFKNTPKVHFQEVFTVASSSTCSPMPDAMSTPHLQLKRLRKELAHEGEIRDELERELDNQTSIISEKEGLISQLQHRVERMLRERREMEDNYKAALLELQEKNERLLHRVHEVVKQCQDLKTDNSQKEKKIDDLNEENGALTAQVRNSFAQLARAEEEVCKLTLAHESSQAEWMKRKEFLEKELNEAVTHKECLSEQVQILQGKISVLVDELKKAQESGEVLQSYNTAMDTTLPFMAVSGGLLKAESLQTEIVNLSEEISLKDEEIQTLSTALKEQMNRCSENEVQKRELSSLKEKCTSIQNQLTAAKQSELQQELRHQETLKDKTRLEKNLRKLQAEISALCSEKDTQVSALKAQMKDQQLRSERLRAELELKVKNQNSKIAALKNVTWCSAQQNKDLVAKLGVMLKQLECCSAKHQETQKRNISLEKSLQASRREVRALQTGREQAKTKVHYEVSGKEQRNKTDTEALRHRNPLTARGMWQDVTPDRSEVDGSVSANAQGDGVENKSDHGANDWMRIAELQARNKACLPHLKSSYALESRPAAGLPSFSLTDEDVRLGDPRDTIRRAGLHFQESQNEHTPESRKRTPEPQQRQSVMFTVVNTPKMCGNGLKQRGLKRLHDACKSPTASGLRPAVRAGNRSPQILSPNSPRSSSAKPLQQSQLEMFPSFNTQKMCGNGVKQRDLRRFQTK